MRVVIIMITHALLVAWTYFHSLAHDHGFQNQIIFQMMYDSTGDEIAARRLVRASSLGAYDVNPQTGIVTRSDIAYEYVKWYHREAQGRVLKAAVFVARHIAAVQVVFLVMMAIYIKQRIEGSRPWTIAYGSAGPRSPTRTRRG